MTSRSQFTCFRRRTASSPSAEFHVGNGVKMFRRYAFAIWMALAIASSGLAQVPENQAVDCRNDRPWALIERPDSCGTQPVGAVYDRPTLFVQEQVEPTAQAAKPAQQPPVQEADQVVRPIETARTPSTIRKIFTNFAHDQKGIWTSPFNIDRQDAKWWALFGGGTAALIAVDENLSNRLPESPNRVRFSKKVSNIGAAYTTLPVAGGLYLYGRLRNDPKARETGVLGAETLLDSYLLVAILKLAFGRE